MTKYHNNKWEIIQKHQFQSDLTTYFIEHAFRFTHTFGNSFNIEQELSVFWGFFVLSIESKKFNSLLLLHAENHFLFDLRQFPEQHENKKRKWKKRKCQKQREQSLLWYDGIYMRNGSCWRVAARTFQLKEMWCLCFMFMCCVCMRVYVFV